MMKYFEEISDRQQWKIKYNLVEVIVLTIIAVTAGAEHWNEIAMYCKTKEAILRKKLDLIDVQNCTITSNAMSCQKKTVQKIRKKNCNYAICLKGNQGTLHEDVKLYFETALKEPQFYTLSQTKTLDNGHG